MITVNAEAKGKPRQLEDNKYGDIFVNQKKYRIDYKTIYQ